MMSKPTTLLIPVLIGAVLAPPSQPTFADDSAGELDETELAMALGIDVGVADTSVEHELFGELTAHYPDAAQAWHGLPETRQAQLLDIYRDAGHLPTIAKAVAGAPAIRN